MKKALILMVTLVIFLSACTIKKEENGCFALSGEDRAKCFSAQAAETLNIEFCENLQEQELKKECIEGAINARLSPEDCSRFDEESDIDFCVYTVAKKTKDMDICEKISALITKDSCYLDMVSTYGLDACQSITGSGLKELCEKTANKEENINLEGVNVVN